MDDDGNVWVTDFVANAEGTKGHQVHKFSPNGELLMSLGTAGQPGSGPDHFNQPSDVVIAPDGSIFVADGHSAQGLTTRQAIEEGREAGVASRIVKFAPDGTFIMEWGRVGTLHGEFRTPHGIEIDAQGRVLVADRGNHRIEIFDQEGDYLDSLYSHGRTSGIYITADEMLYSIDSESSMLSHPNWVGGVRISPLHEDRVVGFIPPFEADTRPYQGAAGRGRRGGRGRQRVRGRGAELAALRGWSVHEVRGRLITAKHSPGLVGWAEHFDMLVHEPGLFPCIQWRVSPLHSSGDASRLTGLSVGHICPICALLTHIRRAPRRSLFLGVPLDSHPTPLLGSTDIHNAGYPG